MLLKRAFEQIKEDINTIYEISLILEVDIMDLLKK